MLAGFSVKTAVVVIVAYEKHLNVKAISQGSGSIWDSLCVPFFLVRSVLGGNPEGF